MVHRFGRNDGMVSQVRFLKTGEAQKPGDYIFYVKDTRHVVKFNLKTKAAKLIGQLKHSCLAMSVAIDKPRREEMKQALRQAIQNDPEQGSPIQADDFYKLVALDES
mmetsp:Transcript_4382/g.7412  ORF Transcript_4382/g.7412 Transcript_4382/m.7412 type:complete len:107 (+) Transcript_4382:617-937(+)